MKKTLLFCTIFLITSFGCKNISDFNPSKEHLDNIKIEVRSGYEIISVKLNSDGSGISRKGTGTYYTEERDSISFNDSISFKSNSFEILNENLNSLKSNAYNGSKYQDAPRVEIYFNEDKLYSGYSWNSEFWEIIRPVIQEIPEKFNPFMVPAGNESD